MDPFIWLIDHSTFNKLLTYTKYHAKHFQAHENI